MSLIEVILTMTTRLTTITMEDLIMTMVRHLLHDLFIRVVVNMSQNVSDHHVEAFDNLAACAGILVSGKDGWPCLFHISGCSQESLEKCRGRHWDWPGRGQEKRMDHVRVVEGFPCTTLYPTMLVSMIPNMIADTEAA